MENRIGKYQFEELDLVRWPHLSIMAIATRRGDILLFHEALPIFEEMLAFYGQVTDGQIREYNRAVEKADVQAFNANCNLVRAVREQHDEEVEKIRMDIEEARRQVEARKKRNNESAVTRRAAGAKDVAGAAAFRRRHDPCPSNTFLQRQRSGRTAPPQAADNL